LTPAALWQLERTCQSLWEATPARSEGLTVVKMCFHGLGHAAVHASLRALPSELLGERQRLRVQDYGTCREPPPFTLDLPWGVMRRVIEYAGDLCDGAPDNEGLLDLRLSECYGGLYHSVFKSVRVVGTNWPCEGVRNPLVCEARFFEFDIFKHSPAELDGQLREDAPRDPSLRALFYCRLSSSMPWFFARVHNATIEHSICPFESLPLSRMRDWKFVSMISSKILGYAPVGCSHESNVGREKTRLKSRDRRREPAEGVWSAIPYG
jgi:hypothetical protein